AVEVKVKDGIMTSSSGPAPLSIAAISNAPVHDGVISTRLISNRSCSKLAQLLVKKPSADSFRFSITRARYSISLPVINGLLNGIPSDIALPRPRCLAQVLFGSDQRDSRHAQKQNLVELLYYTTGDSGSR